MEKLEGKKVNNAFVAHSTALATTRERSRLKILKEGKRMHCSQAQRDGLIAYHFFPVKCYFTDKKSPISNNQSRMKKNDGKSDLSLSPEC